MRSGLIAINIAAVIFGSAALFGKLNVSPFWIVASRGAFACIALFLFNFYKRELDFSKGFAKIIPLAFTGVLLAAHWLTFFASVQMAGVAIATLTFATFPLFTVLFESIKARRLPSLMQLVAAVAIVAAVALLIDSKTSGSQAWGTVAGFVSAITFAIFGITSKQLTSELTPLTVSFMQNLVVATVVAFTLPFSEALPTTSTDWICLILLGVVTTALMHQLYLFALTKLSATVCSGFISLEPVYAILFAALFFNEPVTVWIAISGVLIIGASLVLLRSEASNVTID